MNAATDGALPKAAAYPNSQVRVGFGQSKSSNVIKNRCFASHAEFLDALEDPSLVVKVTGIDPGTGKLLKDGTYITAPMRDGKRGKDNTEAAHHVCLDIDDGNPALTESRMRDGLNAMGFVCMFWGTTNSTDAAPRWRAVFCLDSPVGPDEFTRIQHELESRLRGELGLSATNADTSAGNPFQPQFLRPEGSASHRLEAGLKLVPVAALLKPKLGSVSAAVVGGGLLQKSVQTVAAPWKGKPVLEAFAARGWLGKQRAAGQWAVECPFKDGHTTPSPADGSDTVIFEPNHGGYVGWGFKCMHAHCAQRKFDPDIVNALGLVHAIDPLLNTDMANAVRFVSQHGADVRFTTEQGWMVWNGAVWEADKSSTGMMLRAKRVARSILEEVATAACDPDDELFKWARRSQSAERLRAMITLASSEPDIPLSLTEFDADPMLLNCQNGTLNLITGELRPHCRDDLITKSCAAEYHEGAECPLWDGFLWKALGGDKELYDYAQRAVGYSLTGQTHEQIFFICYGSGANGKSVFLETIGGLIGDYGTTARTEMVMVRSGSSIPNDIAGLRGLRFVAVNEIADGQRFNEPLIKDLVGGDTVSARFLFREFFTYRPQFKLWLRGNHKPTVHGMDHGIWRRINLLPFTVTIPPEEQDPELLQKLQLERPGILAWAVEGCRMWQADGLRPPARVLAAIEEYRAEMDAIGQFLAEKTENCANSSLKAGDLYEVYKDWTEANGEFRLNLRRFGTAIRERGFARFRNEKGVHYRGLQLRKGGVWAP